MLYEVITEVAEDLHFGIEKLLLRFFIDDDDAARQGAAVAGEAAHHLSKMILDLHIWLTTRIIID